MRNRIVGVLGVLIGAVLLLRFNTINDPPGRDVNVERELLLVLFAAVIFIAGLNTLFKDHQRRRD